MFISLGWIYGLMFGVEAISTEQCQEMEIAWGLVFDIGIIRIMITYDYFDEAKAA
jgi:hypothetical protein